MVVEESPAVQELNLTVTVKIENLGDSKVKAAIPPELHLTPHLLKVITEGLASQGLVLVHLDIAPNHKSDLEGLPNVILKEGTE